MEVYSPFKSSKNNPLPFGKKFQSFGKKIMQFVLNQQSWTIEFFHLKRRISDSIV